jgi:tRNA threonylcarbamoyladenosine biosynthesis protein TsaB
MSATPVVFALDTSHPKGSVAVARGEEILCEILFDASDTHSATLLPSVDACFKAARVSLGDVDRIAVVTGPGSFTGLRIGLATVKAFAAVHRVPVVPLVSLEVLAAAFPFLPGPVVPLIDARRGEVYAACYRTVEGSPVEIVPVFSATPERLAEALAAAGPAEPLVLCGTGALRYRAELESAMPAGTRFAGARWSYPSAALAAVMALDRPAVAAEELAAIEPLYVRPPDAKLPADARLRECGGA